MKTNPDIGSTVETQNAHTPLPWYVAPGTHYQIRTSAPLVTGKLIAQVVKGRDAELIVKAVNNFDALRGALDGLLTKLDCYTSLGFKYDEEYKAARTALAKAGEA